MRVVWLKIYLVETPISVLTTGNIALQALTALDQYIAAKDSAKKPSGRASEVNPTNAQELLDRNLLLLPPWGFVLGRLLMAKY